jgi:DNA-binding GntR family transcriptional regulator
MTDSLQDGVGAGGRAAPARGAPGVPGRPISHFPLRHAVLEEVRGRIVAGRWRQGERLFEDQIAAELEVSRNPVREALQALAAEGFVDLEPRRGARVATVSAERAGELFEVREALEGLVASLAAERRTDDQLAALQALVAHGAEAAARSDHEALAMLNTSFHQHLGAAAGNGLLCDTIARLRHVIQWVYSRSIGERGVQSWDEHAAIVAAVADRDSDRARALACAHIAEARAAYLGAVTVP